MGKIQFITVKLPLKNSEGNIFTTPSFDPQEIISHFDTDDDEIIGNYCLDDDPYKVEIVGDFLHAIYMIDLEPESE